MADTLTELVDYLASAGLGVAGTSIFQGLAPDDPDSCIVLEDAPGEQSESAFGSATGGWEKPAVIVRCRGPRQDYASARALAYRAFSEIRKIVGATVGGTFYHYARPQQSPYLLDVDEKGRPEVGFVVAIEKSISTP